MDFKEIAELDFVKYLEIKEQDTNKAFNIINTYFHECSIHYRWLEFECGEFNSDYIPPYRWDYLYEYATIMETGIEGVIESDDKLSKAAYFLMLITVFDKVNYVDFNYYPNLVKNFDILLKKACCDWFVFIARSLFAIGNYFLIKKDAKEAIKYYEAGASLDFDGRQTSLPFRVVADCNLVLGYLYSGLFYEKYGFEKLELEKNEDLAYEYFTTAIDTIGAHVISEKKYPEVYKTIREYEEKHEMESRCFDD